MHTEAHLFSVPNDCLWYDKLWGPSQRVVTLFLIDHFILLAAASQEALGPRKEPAGLLPGSDDRPADVLLPFLANGKDAALDVSVVNPLQQQLAGSCQGKRKGSPTCLQYQNGEIQ